MQPSSMEILKSKPPAVNIFPGIIPHTDYNISWVDWQQCKTWPTTHLLMLRRMNFPMLHTHLWGKPKADADMPTIPLLAEFSHISGLIPSSRSGSMKFRFRWLLLTNV